ncbi:carbonic anhydrase [Pontibacter locisalis]|uniref:Carbonic anhydrase n=1 Tax=Pontibacter locisalis TaxID=1719035 RepID=A0ABW5INQ0_9BACT
MKNRLFLICPASNVEHFLKRKYHGNCYFLTALAGVFQFQDKSYTEELIDVVERERIEEIVVVNDTSCRFMYNVLAKQKGYNTHAEQILIDLLIENYSKVMEKPSITDQVKQLAEVNVRRQIEELLSINYFLQEVVLQKISISGLITSKAAGEVVEVETLVRELTL